MNGSRKYGRGKGYGYGSVHGYRPQVQVKVADVPAGAGWAVWLFWAVLFAGILVAVGASVGV